MLLEHKPRKTERTNRYRISSTKNRRKSLQEMPLPGACETLKPQQDSWTGQAKRMPKKLFHVTFGTHNLLCFWSTSLARRNARKGIESLPLLSACETLKAVMAEQLDGDTIHHALGLNWNGAGNGISEAKLLELCARTLQWRWLFIDEISMVSAELLARLELRCRELVRDISARKFASNRGDARCFGGLNVCVSGDLWQLPPPRGTFLGDVPWEMITKCSSKKLVQTIHGQELIWGYGGHGVQGVTELVQCERNHDEWLQELQDQLRHGQLSDENHALLHGHMTKRPGSVCKGRVTCGQANCPRLLQQQGPASIVWRNNATCAKGNAPQRH